ncbi:hypothetical protein [Shinella sp.]|uniref:hypothetical protein n=1 Tax=Shinella sp. TaxID=1870904 RepID=UPI0029AACE91|nr:hypothetical protein [Shinella sp.]MDX3976710.1 hypothetical protein [Shinella sp.]
MSQLESNILSVSAESVRELLAESNLLAAQSVEKALEAGNLLIAAKAECQHGQWLPFLERAGVGERKAQRYMRLAASGLKSDTVTAFGGIRAALEFLSRRRLPSANEGRCITPHSSNDNPFEAYEAAFIWPSRTVGFFHGAYFADDGSGGMNVTYSRRPLSDQPLPGDRESMVWLYEEKMATPIEDRHYHWMTLPAVFAVADALGIVDCMYEASRDEFERLEKAQSARTLESLSDMYGSALERLQELLKERSVANYEASTAALSEVSSAILGCDDPKLLHRIAVDDGLSRLAQRVDVAMAQVGF